MRAEVPDWTTSAREVTDITSSRCRRRDARRGAVAFVEVEVTHQVVGYVRRMPPGEVLDMVELDMPAQTLATRAVMYTVTPESLCAAGLEPDDPRLAARRRTRGDRAAAARRHL